MNEVSTFEQGSLFEPPSPQPRDTATAMTPTWTPTPDQLARYRARFPTLDVDAEIARFRAYWRTKGVARRSWTQSLNTWLEHARGFEAERRLHRAKTEANPAAVTSLA